MPTSKDSSAQFSREDAKFTDTHWSVIWAALASDSEGALEAIEKLCVTYWGPIYFYLRRCGLSVHEAEDLTQEFFASRVATGQIFKGISPERGKFRTWLLNSVQNLMRNQWNRQQAQKRGGCCKQVPLDVLEVERKYSAEQLESAAPEELYDCAWAWTLVQQVLAKLQAQYEGSGRGVLFQELKCFLPGAVNEQVYARVASRLDKTEDAVRTAICRLRREFRDRLRAEVARTVTDPSDIQEELRYLFAVLQRGHSGFSGEQNLKGAPGQ